MKVVMVCSAELTNIIVVNHLILDNPTGSFPMELVFPVQVTSGTSTELEVRVWYVCNGGEVEQMGSTAVQYLYLNQMQKM